jgi:hypothetical protein
LVQTITGSEPVAVDEHPGIGLKDFAQKRMKRFSHAKDKEKINRYVDNHCAIGETFALAIPVSVL